ncbi:hypothetical protein DIPPA_17507 [Diplonema papillatum]|nr:hypothetical protein DIPPA_17507 [Diplonema papillatum]
MPLVDMVDHGVGKLIRPPRQSLSNDFSGTDRERYSTGRRNILPRHEEPSIRRRNCSPERAAMSPPPYGVGQGTPQVFPGGRRQTYLSEAGRASPNSLAAFSPAQCSISPGNRKGHYPRDALSNLYSTSCAPLAGTDRVAPRGRSRSCPPVEGYEAPLKHRAVSPMKTASQIGVKGGTLAGDGAEARAGKNVNPVKNDQHFVVSRQHHALHVHRTVLKSKSPQRADHAVPVEELPHYIAKRRAPSSSITVAGSGTAGAMCWNGPPLKNFAKRRLQHTMSDSVQKALSGKGIPEPPRGRRGVLSQQQTFCSNVVTVPSMMPLPPRTAQKRSVSHSAWNPTRLW